LYSPRQQHLRRRLSNARGDCCNDWIFKRPRPGSMAQWRKGQKDNAIPLAEFQKLRFWQMGM
jgi:hypothetical protein